MHTAKEALWLRNFVDEIRGPLGKPIGINYDHQGAIALTKDNTFYSQMKHIDLHYHFIREAVEDNKIEMEYIPSNNKIADIFTKALARPKFTGLVGRLGLREVEEKKEGQ